MDGWMDEEEGVLCLFRLCIVGINMLLYVWVGTAGCLLCLHCRLNIYSDS